VRVRGAGWSASIAAGSRRFARRDRLASPQITADDCELIEQALAEGRLRRIERGVSGLAPEKRRTGRKARP
jgi:hypothetical protein